jgi:hypothetical protein
VKLRWLYGSKSENAVYFGKLKVRVSEIREEFTEVKARMASTSVNWWLELVKLRWLYGSKSEKAVYFGKLKARVSETREEFTEVKGRKPSTSVIQRYKKETNLYI